MEFTKNEFQAFRKDFDQALLPVAEKYSLTIKAGSISYQDDTFSMKVECAKTDAGNLEQKEFEKYCLLYELSPDDYMREFVFNGERYTLAGLAVSSPKYPCICLNIGNGKRYKLTEDAVKKAFKQLQE